MPNFKENTRRKLIGFGIIFYLVAVTIVYFKISRFWSGIIMGIGFADIIISNFLMKRWKNKDPSQ